MIGTKLGMLTDEIEQDELLLGTALGFRGQQKDGLIQPPASGLAEEFFAILDGESVLGESSVDAVFDGVTKFGESHPRAGEFSFVADVVRGNPDSGECAIVLQDGQAVGVDLVGLACLSADRLTLPIITLALTAWARRGRQPAASISSAIQYQLPTVSRATGVPGGNWEQNSRIAPRACWIRPFAIGLARESRTSNCE
jgi:hypothetical protein